MELKNKLGDYLRSLESSLMTNGGFKINLLIYCSDDLEKVLAEKWQFNLHQKTVSEIAAVFRDSDGVSAQLDSEAQDL